MTIQTLPLSERRADINCSIKLKLADGKYFAIPENEQNADNDGVVSWTWEVPADSPEGDATIYVTAGITNMPGEATARVNITYSKS